MLLLEEASGPSRGVNPGLAGLEFRESLVTDLMTKRLIAEEYVVRHILSIQRALEAGDLENAKWLPVQRIARRLDQSAGRLGSAIETSGIWLR